MRIAIYGRDFNDSVLPFVQEVFDALAKQQVTVLVYLKFYNFIKAKVKLPANITTFSTHAELLTEVDVLLSLGGDGTLLDTLSLIRDSQIPVIGSILDDWAFWPVSTRTKSILRSKPW